MSPDIVASGAFVFLIAFVYFILWRAANRPPHHSHLGFSDPFAGSAEEQGLKMWEDLERRRGRHPAMVMASRMAEEGAPQRTRIRLSGTHTFALLEVPSEMFDLVAAKLKDAGYDDAFVDGYLDMHGIALERSEK